MVIKRLIILLLCIWCGVARGATFCAESDKVVLGVDYENSKTSGYVGTGFDWQINIPDFGVVSGIASCSSLKPDVTSVVNNCHTASSSEHWGAAAAVNGDVNDNYYGRDDGSYCWCKMIRPFESGWIHFYIYNRNCPENCASSCASYLSSRNLTYPDNRYGTRTWACMLATVGLND